MRFRHIACLATILTSPLMAPASEEAAPAEAPAEGVAFLADYRGGGYLLYFLNRRGEFQKERFVTEGAMELDFSLAAWPGGTDARLRFAIITGMGRSIAQNLPFSPKEMEYEIHAYVEHRTPRWLFSLGWLHACQHLIYKDDEIPWYEEYETDIPPDVYFNRLHAGVGSPEFRRDALVQTLLGPNARSTAPRVIWHIEAGGYLRSLGGWMDSESLYGDNDWAWDVKAELILPLKTRASWALCAASRNHLLLDTRDKAAWRSRLELEAFFARRGYGSSVFLTWNAVDEHPRDSRKGLLELGARFFF